MWGNKTKPTMPSPEPETPWWTWHAIDFHTILATLIVSGTITAAEADAIEHDRAFLSGNPYQPTTSVARDIEDAIARARTQEGTS
jgi:hypothetical protein